MRYDSETLRRRFGNWGNHSRYPHSDWQHEVAENNTRLGYWEWVASLLQQEAADFVAAFESITPEDADRLLSLGDQFLEDWSEDAVQNGKRDSDYEQRINEWRQIRPLLAAAPKMLKSLLAVIEAGRITDLPPVLYCAEIARTAIASIRPQQTPSQSE
jgi:hypothetical protein